jgi:DNA-binding NtrC family response regulator
MNSISTSDSNSSVLVVDDEPGMRTALQANFLRHGWRVETASGVRDAARAVELTSFDLVVSDIRMRDGDGFEVMCSVLKNSPTTAVILLTAFGSVPEAVESMRSGAFDYLTKPVSFEQLQSAAARVMKRINEKSASGSIQDTRARCRNHHSGIVGRAPLLLQALHRARAAASTDADVLIEAESGTGKELLAKFIHQASNRSRKPFVAVNCAAVPEHLLESELFGHAKGAFTGASAAKAGKFELANGGTLLLDEIGEMPLNLQPKLLRILQEREFERLGETRSIHVDIRVIATTNASLGSMVEQGRFRSDLYYRLNVIPLSLPKSSRAAGGHSGAGQVLCREICCRNGQSQFLESIRVSLKGCRVTIGPATFGNSRISCAAFSPCTRAPRLTRRAFTRSFSQ